MNDKTKRLHQYLRDHAPIMIAFSGGVDSTYLLAVAKEAVGDDAMGVIADSPSLPRQALKDALDLAKSIHAKIEILKTEEMDDPNYVSNPVNRCYFCKAELFEKMNKTAEEKGFRAIAYGENADDALQIRPGLKAAQQFQVLAPLKAVGMTKEEIRIESRRLGLPTADAPAQPCLSSRIPHGIPVTREALELIEKGEAFTRSLGFKVFRVRHVAEPGKPAAARVLIAPEEFPKLTETVRLELINGLKDAGYDSVEIDPEGYKAPALQVPQAP